MHSFRYAAGLVFVVFASACAAQECRMDARRVSGQVLDPTGAAVVRAKIGVDGMAPVRDDGQGRFSTGCLAPGSHTVTVEAEGFQTATESLEVGALARPLVIHLRLRAVETEVDAVSEDALAGADNAGSKTLVESDLKQMADDPDELARQLQVLAAAGGGSPGQAIIAVDGFQNSGRIPPKSAIAFIRVNPDLFAAEYERPPYQGGRVEIYTKPGQSSFHGALFTTLSAPWLNAKDPFALSRAAIGKQRYGFELSGPATAKRSDFAVALEHRQIDQFSVVNAVALDGADNPVSVVANVAAPQTLWQGSARLAAMLSAKNNFTGTYTADVNSLRNVGVGGTVLAEAGYDSVQAEHALRLTNLMTVSPRLLHETRVGYTWRYRNDAPHSTAASVQVAGSFTGGGAPTQAMHDHERDLEVDDDVLYARGKHTVKAGFELLNVSYHNTMPTNFNGSYVFGGGPAPASDGNGGTTTISGLEQYARTLEGLPGGSPTSFYLTTGRAAIALNQFRIALYAQDQWKLRPRLQLMLGLRWSMQSTPATVGGAGPRIGLAWSPDRAQRWIFHVRSGLFFTPVDAQAALEAERLNGSSNQVQSLEYSPHYDAPLSGGGTVLTTLRAPVSGLSQTPSVQTHLGVEHEFPRHWHTQANLYLVRAWDVLRSRNINAPLDGSPFGERPLAPNENLDQYQQTGTLHGNVLFFGVDQRTLRRLQVFAGYIRMDLRTNADSDSLFPQQSFSDAGEDARPSWLTTHHGIVFSTLTLPKAVALTTQFDAASGQPYNVTTGFDNNGDGVFNDRPFRSGTAGVPAYATAFGTLSPTGTGQTLGRNAGTMPWSVHLDMNLSRTFKLNHPSQGEAKSVAVNLRSTNALNYTNITAVGGVLGSPFFGQGYAGSAGRRIEAGLRYSF